MNAVVQTSQCRKCSGSGRFVSYAGRDCGPCFACQGTGQHTSIQQAQDVAGAGLDKLTAMFSRAMESLKRPAFIAFGIRFSPAGADSRNPGAIYVKRNGSGEYFGKVTGGQYIATREADSTVRELVADVLRDPLSAAIRSGHETGRCSCCGRELSDIESVALGIGPVCRKRFFHV